MFFAAVAGGRWNKATNNATVVSGGEYNSAGGAYAVISGGHQNTASTYYSVIGKATRFACCNTNFIIMWQ